MSVFEAVALGIVQGLTEFLPISSSAHLVLVPQLLGWDTPSVTFIVLLHAASLLALVAHFRSELVSSLSNRTTLLLIVAATAPAAIFGLLFEKRLEEAFSRPKQVAIQLAVTGVILIVAELLAKGQSLSRDNPTHGGAVAIGLAQAASIIPGISRSGATIAAGVFAGLTRQSAARFSFLIAIPILGGTSLYKIPDISASTAGGGALVAGFLASLVASYLAIRTLIAFLATRRLYGFATYCFVSASVSLILL